MNNNDATTRDIKDYRKNWLFTDCIQFQLLCYFTPNHPRSTTFHTANHYSTLKIKSIVLSFIISLTIGFCIGQDTEKDIFSNRDYIYVFVTDKGKVMLNGEKSNLKKLELYLKSSDKTKAKIGTITPTPLEVFVVFQRVVKLFEVHNIDAEWYRDPEFSKPFFDEEK